MISAKWVFSDWHKNQPPFSTLNSCQTITAKLRCPPRGQNSSCRVLSPNALDNWRDVPMPCGLLGWGKEMTMGALGSRLPQSLATWSQKHFPLSRPWGLVSWVAGSKFFLPSPCQVSSGTSLESDFTFIPQSSVRPSSADWWGSCYSSCLQQTVLSHCCIWHNTGVIWRILGCNAYRHHQTGGECCGQMLNVAFIKNNLHSDKGSCTVHLHSTFPVSNHKKTVSVPLTSQKPPTIHSKAQDSKGSVLN